MVLEVLDQQRVFVIFWLIALEAPDFKARNLFCDEIKQPSFVSQWTTTDVSSQPRCELTLTDVNQVGHTLQAAYRLGTCRSYNVDA